VIYDGRLEHPLPDRKSLLLIWMETMNKHGGEGKGSKEEPSAGMVVYV
jgi:hypothetical protein